MSGPNNNYVGSLTGFSNADFYEAASIAQFNAIAATDFHAFVLILINGQYQLPLQASDAVPQFLWGNEDNGNNTGWSIRILPGGAPAPGAAIDPVVVGRVGNGAGYDEVYLPLSDSVVGSVSSAYIERLMLLQLGFFDDGVNQVAMLAVNGDVAEVLDTGNPYVASALAPRLGLSPGGADEASGVEVVGCGFSRGNLFGPNPAAFFSNAFRTARGNFETGFITGLGSLDWIHRWAAETPNPGIIAKTSAGAFQQQLPAAPAVLTDRGSSGVNNPLTGLSEAAIALNLTGTIRVDQRKNPDWYHGGGTGFRGGVG